MLMKKVEAQGWRAGRSPIVAGSAEPSRGVDVPVDAVALPESRQGG